jgi:hypothetical protein
MKEDAMNTQTHLPETPQPCIGLGCAARTVAGRCPECTQKAILVKAVIEASKLCKRMEDAYAAKPGATVGQLKEEFVALTKKLAYVAGMDR